MKALGDLWPLVCEFGDGLRWGFGFGLQGGQVTSSLETPRGPHLYSNKRNKRCISIKFPLLKPPFLQSLISELKFWGKLSCREGSHIHVSQTLTNPQEVIRSDKSACRRDRERGQNKQKSGPCNGFR